MGKSYSAPSGFCFDRGIGSLSRQHQSKTNQHQAMGTFCAFRYCLPSNQMSLIALDNDQVSISFLLKVIWASPNTVLGLVIGGIGMCFGSKAQVTERAIEFYDGGIKWLLYRFPNGQFVFAMTLGHVVIGKTAAALDISRAHETVHVRQYERWGPLFIPAYVIASVYVWSRGRRLYRDNPFEIEAYAVDDMSQRRSDKTEFD